MSFLFSSSAPVMVVKPTTDDKKESTIPLCSINSVLTAKQLALMPGLLTGSSSSSASKSSKGGKSRKGGIKFSAKPLRSTTFTIGTAVPHAVNPSMDSMIYRIVRHSSAANTVTSSASVPVLGAISFTLADVNDVSSLTSVFDQYRIVRIDVWMLPRSDLVTSTSINPGDLITAIDYDDSTAAGSTGAMLDFSNAMVSTFGIGHFRSFNPHVAVGMYDGSVFTSYGNETSPWIDAASTGVKHFGFKYGVTQAGTASSMDVQARYLIEFRNSR